MPYLGQLIGVNAVSYFGKEAGAADGPAQGKRIDLYHVGWKVGESLYVIRDIYQKLSDMDYPVEAMSDHMLSRSLYMRGPDGNEVELFVDNPAIDRCTDKYWLDAPVQPLKT